jgi:pyruvate dehydrogenase E2 component (dihydrolipoamide acetyltransferase)
MAIIKDVKVPDIGDFKNVGIIEVMVKNGDQVKVDQPLITVESDKATMDIPSPYAGVVKDLLVKVGNKISEGSVILMMELTDAVGGVVTTPPVTAQIQPEVVKSSTPSYPLPGGDSESMRSRVSPPLVESTTIVATSTDPRRPRFLPSPPVQPIDTSLIQKPHAGPAVRQMARELGVELTRVKGSGPKGRVLKEDVKTFVKQVMFEGTVPGAVVPLTGGGMGIPPIPEIDFSKFGEIETRPLSRIKKLSGASVYRSWLNVPQVTQFDEADITELEEFRKDLAEEAKKRNIKVTMLAFLLKASVAALKQFPDFNTSLDASKENLIVKKYYHLGVAVDTPNGLVVPVIREVNFKGLFDLAAELGTISQKARDGKLSPTEMQGASFTISSLGGIGGTGFTPIVNAPEVAILGVSRSQLQPVYQNGQLVPRLILPFSVSYDHRVIDGAAAARFTSYLSFILSDVRRLLL